MFSSVDRQMSIPFNYYVRHNLWFVGAAEVLPEYHCTNAKDDKVYSFVKQSGIDIICDKPASNTAVSSEAVECFLLTCQSRFDCAGASNEVTVGDRSTGP
jgi:hypothetical protein